MNEERLERLEAALREARAALTGSDRFHVGDVVREGYWASNIAEIVHLTCIALTKSIEGRHLADIRSGDIRQYKAQIERNYNLAKKAIRRIDAALEG